MKHGHLTALLLIIVLAGCTSAGITDCAQGYVFNPRSGVGCQQKDCGKVPHSFYDYTGHCVCYACGEVGCSGDKEYSKACKRPSIYKECPNCVYACVNPKSRCPDTCPNGVCDKAELEDCGTCPQDCKCQDTKTQIRGCDKTQPNADDIGCYALVTCPPNSHVEHEGCECDSGYGWNDDDTRCIKGGNQGVKKPTTTTTIKTTTTTVKITTTTQPSCGDGKCEKDKGESQSNCCKDCGCPDCYNCRNNQCVQGLAIIATSNSSEVGHGWYGRARFWPQKKLVEQYFQMKGCNVVYRDVDGDDALAELLAQDDLRAFAYFGHGAKSNPRTVTVRRVRYNPKTDFTIPYNDVTTRYTPNMEEAPAAAVKNMVVTRMMDDLVNRYIQQGLSQAEARKRARQEVNARTTNGYLDFFYNNACFSFDDTSMPDNFVKPGGTYWGNEGSGFAGVPLTGYVKPKQGGGTI